jgi:uncharacterized protein
MIDAYCHILPSKYKEAFYGLIKKNSTVARFSQIEDEYEKVPALFDMESRFKIMDQFPGMRQVLTVSGLPVEMAGNSSETVDLAKLANDELAKLVKQYPDRFAAGVASLPMNNPKAALKEAARSIEDLKLKGVQIYTPCCGKPLDAPEFWSLYRLMADYELPIWIHPYRSPEIPDYSGENISRYRLFHIFGWPYDTSLSMARLVFGGVLEKFPNLKFVTHHCGGMIPFFAKRIASQGRRMVELEGFAETPLKLSRPILDYFQKFYGDTALSGHVPALMCGYEFFGAEHLLLATDMPYGGSGDMVSTIKSIGDMPIPPQEKEKILEGNIQKLLHL